MPLPYQPPFIAPPPPGLAPGFYTWAMRLVDVVNGVLGGKQNNTGSITLVANSATTDIVDARISATSVILFMPLTANASAEVAAGTMRVSSQTTGQATITHVNGPSTTRSFRFLIAG